MARTSLKNQALSASGDLGLSQAIQDQVAEVTAKNKKKKKVATNLTPSGKKVSVPNPSQTNPFGPNPAPMSAAAQSLLGHMMVNG